MPASTNTHEITRLAAPSKSAPGTRQTTRALANRSAAIEYQIAASNQGSEKKKRMAGSEPALGPVAVAEYASAEPPISPQMTPLIAGMITAARLSRLPVRRVTMTLLLALTKNAEI
jgi:hypothetical protein